jgi:hypothetical protein
MWLGHIHMHIHIIWRLSKTLYVFDIDVGTMLIESTASITAHLSHLMPRRNPAFCGTSTTLVKGSNHNVVRTHPYAHPHHMKVVKDLVCVLHWCREMLIESTASITTCVYHLLTRSHNSGWLQKAWSLRVVVLWLGQIHMHIHILWRLSKTLHVFVIDVGTMLIEYTASFTALHLYLLQGVTSNSRWLPKAWSRRGTVMRLGHIQMHIHIIWKLPKILYVFYIDVEDNLDWVYNFNNHSWLSFDAQELPRILGDFQKLGQGEQLWQLKKIPLCLIKKLPFFFELMAANFEPTTPIHKKTRFNVLNSFFNGGIY